MRSLKFKFPILLILLISLLIFWQTFLKDLYPFPGNYLLAWYEPWKTNNVSVNGTITLAHKAIADDTFRQIYPFKTLAANMFKNFEPPLWNPYNGAGMPLLATINIGYLDPFNLLYLFFPNYLAWSIYIILQPGLIGVFTYLYCRRIRLDSISSMFSSLIFIFSGFVTTRIIYAMFGMAISLFPLTLYLIESYLQNKKTRLIFLLPLVVSLIIVSTQPQISFYILAFCFFYFIYRYLHLNLKLKNLILPAILFLTGIFLSAIQIIPTLELFKFANLNKDSSAFIFNQSLVPFKHILTIFIPNYFGNPSTYNYWGQGDYIQTIAYVGLIPCFFMFFGYFYKEKPNAKFRNFFMGAIIISLATSIDWPFSRLLFSLPIPIISTGIPARIFLLSTFSISILAGIGFSKLSTARNLRKEKLFTNVAFLLLPASILFYTLSVNPTASPCTNGIIRNCQQTALRNTLLETGAFILFFTFFILIIILKKKWFIKILHVVTLLIILVLGLYNDFKFLPFSPKETFLPENNLIKTLKEKTKDNRVFGVSQATIRTDFASYFKFYDPQYYHPLYIKRYGELITFANSGNLEKQPARSDVEISNTATPSSGLKFRRERLYNLLGIKYLIYKISEFSQNNFAQENIIWKDSNWYIATNNSALPRGYLIKNYEIIIKDRKTLKKLFSSSFNIEDSVILSENPNLKRSKEKSKFSVNQIYYKENDAAFKIFANSEAIFVLPDNYYPGWNAYVDGKTTKIYQANYTFRAVKVPQGNHIIEFKYEPLSFKLGIFISVASLLFLAFLFIKRENFYKN